MRIWATEQNFSATKDSLSWQYKGERFTLCAYGENTFRFTASMNPVLQEENYEIIPQKAAKVKITKTEDGYRLQNGKLTAYVNRYGMLHYEDASGKTLLCEYWNDGEENLIPLKAAREYLHVEGNHFNITYRFRANEDEHFYGMGQYPNKCFDLKHTSLDLCQMNTHTSIPFALSSLGYGFVLNSPAVGNVQFAKNVTSWQLNSTDRMDYFIFAEDSPKELLTRYTALCGRAPKFPAYAAGYWQSKLRYETKEEVLDIARKFKEKNIPLSVLVIDFFHWTKQGDFKFDPKFFPNPEEITEELEKQGVKALVSIWPTVEPDSENYKEMQAMDYLLKTENSVQALFMLNGTLTYFDATNPEARAYVWNKIKQNYYDKGFKMFWLDQAEPEIRPYVPSNTRYFVGNGMQVANLYPNQYLKTFYEGMQNEGEKEICNLARSGWLGCQKYGAVLWSGDVVSTFDSFCRQIYVGLNASVAGVAWWTSDIGGFNGGNIGEDAFKELFVRWFQFGAFCPIFRNHGNRLPKKVDPGNLFPSGAENEPWSYGEEVEEITLSYIRLRHALKDYILSHMDEASKTGVSIMRPMFFEYPNEEVCYEAHYQFFFGKNILVAPVTEAGATGRKVYLPKGNWKEVYTGIQHAGGQYVMAQAPLKAIPLFVPAAETELASLLYEHLYL